MPTHVYQPHRNPPTWLDRLLVHPMDTIVALIALVFGALVAVSLAFPGFIPSLSMDRMPTLAVVPVSATLFSGGFLSLVGLNWQGEDVSKGWALERFGWLLAAGGFVTYAISVSWHYPTSAFSWGLPLLLGSGCILRIWSIALIERSMRRTIAKVKGEQP